MEEKGDLDIKNMIMMSYCNGNSSYVILYSIKFATFTTSPCKKSFINIAIFFKGSLISFTLKVGVDRNRNVHILIDKNLAGI